MRNYLSNNQVIKQYNQNPFLANPNRQYYFQGNKMFIKIGNIVNKFIKTDSFLVKFLSSNFLTSLQ